jgi:hypothetical protein
MELTVDSILLEADGSGLVTFRFNVGEPKEWLLEIPYSNSASIDEGVKQAAAQLVQEPSLASPPSLISAWIAR